MVYQVIAVLLFVISAAAVAFTVKLLANKKWIAGFVRGCAGIFFLIAAIFAVLSGKDIYTYKAASGDDILVTVSFHQKDANNYIVELQEPSGAFSSMEIEGQQWQLTARMFTWPPLMSFVGLRPGYRLENISGRFIELQLDNLVGKKQPEVLNTSSLFDVWGFLDNHPSVLPLVSVHLATLGFTPIADGAIYEVVPAGQNLSANPVNDPAKNAIKNW